ncbi:MAG: hypothetical protein JXM70_15870 [Pirellulales bacterium]|nr:hypothetical protein [Pirellulales bacterium]
MRPIDDPSFLTPDERLSEVAGILAVGILRLHARQALPRSDEPSTPENPPESAFSCLEVSDETVLSVHNG